MPDSLETPGGEPEARRRAIRPRRRLLQVAAGLLLGVLAARFAAGRARRPDAREGRPTGAAGGRRGGDAVDVAEVVKALRARGAAVSFIEAGAPAAVPGVPPEATAAALDWVAAAAPAYRWREIRGRAVLFPADPVFDRTVSGVTIAGVPRQAAADAFLAQLRESVPGMQGLAGQTIKGNLRAPLFTQPVTLPAGATVLEHFAALLGDDPRAVFTVRQAQPGVFTFQLERVDGPDGPGGAGGAGEE